VQVNGAFREGDIRHGMADISKAQALLGYEPRTRFESGLKQFLQWAEQAEPELAGYERSLAEMKLKGLLHDRG
jgi:dTDP-L-rhamnose 4-epimerase